MEFAEIDRGAFWMGSTIEEIDACVSYWEPRLLDPSFAPRFRLWLMKEFPKHRVEVPTFRLSVFPVTNSQYREFLGTADARACESIVNNEPETHPVWGVSLQDCNSYCEWLSGQLDEPCRLPTESEWEYAARGADRREYPFGDEYDPSRCNTVESNIGHTTPVDHYENGLSECGIYDMAGNVEEWTCDLYAPYPGGEFVHDDISEQAGGTYPVLRGGSFARGGDLARCARRHGPFPAPSGRYRGFRVVASEALPSLLAP